MPRKKISIFSDKKVIPFFLVFLFVISSVSITAGNNRDAVPAKPEQQDIIRNLQRRPYQIDTTAYYTRGANGLIIMPPEDWDPFPYNVKFRDTVIYNPAYLPVVFDGKILPPGLDFLPKDSSKSSVKFRLIPEEETFAPKIKKANQIQALRRNFYTDMNNVRDVRYSVSELKEVPKLDEEVAIKRNIFNDLITAEDPISISPIELEKATPEFIYWIKHGEHSLQASHNFISDNWQGGGNSNYVIRNYHKFTLNYQKDKITFNNVLEWKLNLQKVFHADKHGTNISEDLLRLENVFGFKAFNKWSYSARLETRTPLFQSYPVNSDDKNTALFSPLNLNLSIGMNYALEKKFASDKAKNLKLSQSISPLSLNYIYLSDTTIVNRQGVETGKRSKLDIGSSINTDLTFNFNRYFSWVSRLKYFTDYDYSYLEFENKFRMELNRYLSTEMLFYFRFDDRETARWEKRLGYFQLNEMITFGLNYRW